MNIVRAPLLIASLAAMTMGGCATVDPMAEKPEARMFDSRTMDHLQFLEGRWIGAGPDGKPFYEAYRRVDANTLVSERYEDDRFAKLVDGSTVALDNGEITSRWGEYTWRADQVRAGFASFAPVNAPSAFTWRRIDADTVEVMQRWNDENGVEQSYALQLKRTK